MDTGKKAAVAAGMLMAMALPATALGAAPGAATGAASAVGSTSATLNGTVSPNKESTTYHFDYGTTTSYGSQTPSASAGGGNAGKSVSAPVTGLAPSTTYHYRLVASNASGTVNGADASFTTGAPGTPVGGGGGKVTISLRPSSIVFGHATTITGKVQGGKRTPTTVTLQQSPFPFTSFRNLATATTDSRGNYRFTAKPSLNTRYQVVARTSPPSTSPIAQENVKFFVSLRLSDSTIRSGQRVRFSGVIRPAHDGGLVQIQRRTRTGWKTISKTLARHSSTGQSAFGKKVRIRHAGLYRARVPRDASHATGTSPLRRIRF